MIVGTGAAAQSSAQVRAFGYQRPDIHATTRPHWAGGHLYIRGHNFGAHDSKITVYIDHEECKYATLVKKHEEIRCRAKPGPADGKEYTVKVRVLFSFSEWKFGNNEYFRFVLMVKAPIRKVIRIITCKYERKANPFLLRERII